MGELLDFTPLSPILMSIILGDLTVTIRKGGEIGGKN